ncbi:MAG: PEP-utilizing enzyme [bacterium]
MSIKWVELAHEKRAHIFPVFWYWHSVQEVAKKVGVEPTIYGCYFKNHEMSYLVEEGCFVRIGQEIFKRLKKDAELITTIEETNKAHIPELLKLSNWFESNKLSEMDGAELFKRYDLVYQEFLKIMEYSIMGTVMEMEGSILGSYLENILKTKFPGRTEKISEYFIILSTDPRITTSQKEEIALRTLRIAERAEGLTEPQIEEHRRQYGHITYNYDGPGWSVEDIMKRMGELSDNPDLLCDEIKEIEHTSIKTAEQKTEIIKELRLNDEERHLFNTLAVLGYWKFERKLACQRSHLMMEALIEEIMHRYHLTKPEAKMITPDEMQEVLENNKVDRDELERRVKLSFAIFEGYDGQKVISGEAAKIIEQELEESLKVEGKVKEIKGTTAYPGRAKGRVVRVDDESEMEKFAEGDILVSTSAGPNIISIMKKAAAIITDSGGITSHAAIVSRELKVPCVIGTKIATKVLKDGDEVEVDATKGIVRKI